MDEQGWGHERRPSTSTNQVDERARPRRWTGPRRSWQSLVGALAAIIVIIGAIGGFGVYKGHWLSLAGAASARPTATPGRIQSLLSIDTSPSGICPTGLAWSPDALKLAVATDSEQSSCDTSDPGRTQVVTIYDARSGAQLNRFSVFVTLQQLQINASSAYASQPSWSPDGRTIVVPFDLLDATGQHSGLLILPVGRGAPRALIDTADTQLTRPIWNLRSGKLVSTQTEALPPALTYRWSADGGIHPAQGVPVGSGAYTGSPVEKGDGASFSRWRRGVIAPVSREGYLGAPFAWFHEDTDALWSPDGQFVAPNYSLETRLPDPAGTTSAALIPQDSACSDVASNAVTGGASQASLATTYCGQKAIAYPDAAYATVVAKARAGMPTKLDSGSVVTSWPAVEVAWRPDGKVLATMLPADDVAVHHAAARVTLYDTATGAVLTTLALKTTLPSSQTNMPIYLSWAPTGQQLALVNNGDSQVIVWGASSLASLPPIAQ